MGLKLPETVLPSLQSGGLLGLSGPDGYIATALFPPYTAWFWLPPDYRLALPGNCHCRATASQVVFTAVSGGSQVALRRLSGGASGGGGGGDHGATLSGCDIVYFSTSST